MLDPYAVRPRITNDGATIKDGKYFDGTRLVCSPAGCAALCAATGDSDKISPERFNCLSLSNNRLTSPRTFLQFLCCRKQGQPRYYAIRIKPVCLATRLRFPVWHEASVLKGQWHELHARSIEIFIDPAPGVHPVKSSHHVAVYHIDDGFGHRLVDSFEGIHPFLHHHFGYLEALFNYGHLVALLAIECTNFVAVLYRHDTHAISSGIGFHDNERVCLDFVLSIFLPNIIQYFIHCTCHAVFTLFFTKVDFAAGGKIRIDKPWIDAYQIGEQARDGIISIEMPGFSAGRPSGMKRRYHRLLEIMQY